MRSDESEKGLVFSIDRFVAEDGPGIRTTVFLKGCPLSCVWCHSPQSQSAKPQLIFHFNRCMGCGACADVCPKNAQQVSADGRSVIWENCDDCLKCVEICPSKALETSGEWMTAEAVLDVVKKDMVYYQNSGGGVTFSGGEPGMQSGFLIECLQKCKQIGIHTALDTSGYINESAIEKLLPLVDLFLFDLKQVDVDKHKKYTGVDNGRILANLKTIGQAEKPVWVRVPIIPGYTDDEENLRQIAELAKTFDNIEKVFLLPYNSAAGAKYLSIGQTYELEHLSPYSQEKAESLLIFFTTLGLNAEIGR